MSFILTPETIIEAYRRGYFPMAESGDAKNVLLVSPERRGLLPIAELHISRSLSKALKRHSIDIVVDNDFDAVIRACAEKKPDRPDTWISPPIIELFMKLHDLGYAHSVECRVEDKLVGGLYGLSIGAAFFGESMFSRSSDASKIALAHLAARLWKGGYELLDTQWVNPHLEQFGCYEIPREEYLLKLDKALQKEADFVLEGMEEGDLLDEYLGFRH